MAKKSFDDKKEKPAKPVKLKQLERVGSHVCSECSKSFDYDLLEDEHTKLMLRKGGNTPLRVKCPHCDAKVVIHGKGPAGTRTARKDWPAGEHKPWEARE